MPRFPLLGDPKTRMHLHIHLDKSNCWTSALANEVQRRCCGGTLTDCRSWNRGTFVSNASLGCSDCHEEQLPTGRPIRIVADRFLHFAASPHVARGHGNPDRTPSVLAGTGDSYSKPLMARSSASCCSTSRPRSPDTGNDNRHHLQKADMELQMRQFIRMSFTEYWVLNHHAYPRPSMAYGG